MSTLAASNRRGNYIYKTNVPASSPSTSDPLSSQFAPNIADYRHSDSRKARKRNYIYKTNVPASSPSTSNTPSSQYAPNSARSRHSDIGGSEARKHDASEMSTHRQVHYVPVPRSQRPTMHYIPASDVIPRVETYIPASESSPAKAPHAHGLWQPSIPPYLPKIYHLHDDVVASVFPTGFEIPENTPSVQRPSIRDT